MNDRTINQGHGPRPGGPIEPRKPYGTPELTSWGSIVELTAGFLDPPADFPFTGGSAPT